MQGEWIHKNTIQASKRRDNSSVWCCDSEGEIDADKVDGIVIDSDGIHRLQ